MAQHGYLREYDEGFGSEDDRERSDWRDRDERDWRSRERGRGFMLGDDDYRRRNEDRGRDHDRGTFSRMGDEARSWFREDEHDYRGGGQGGFGGSSEWRGSPRASSHPDDHYRSWRDRQMRALDQDYADYCREREQQFHRDFDSWRQNRQANRGQQGSTGNQDELILGSGERSGLNAAPGADNEPQATTSPVATATLGTNNSENSGTGRGGRR